MKGGVKLLSLFASFLVTLSLVGLVTAPVTLPVVYVDPAVSTANPLDLFTINVNVQDVVDLYSWGIKLKFDPNVLEIAYHMVGSTKVYHFTEGPFLQGRVDDQGNPIATSFVAKAYLTYMDVGCSTLGAYPGASGSGTLYSVEFKVKDSGKSDLDIYVSTLLDHTVTPIANTIQDGYFYTSARADLVGHGAWPAYHHFVVSKAGPDQILKGKVKNLGTLDLSVYVSFDIVRDDSFVTTVTTATTVIPPETIMELSANFGPLTGADAGKYYVSATVYYSWGGYYFTQGEKLKTFSFAVVP